MPTYANRLAIRSCRTLSGGSGAINDCAVGTAGNGGRSPAVRQSGNRDHTIAITPAITPAAAVAA
jgi:hypothetical protein